MRYVLRHNRHAYLAAYPQCRLRFRWCGPALRAPRREDWRLFSVGLRGTALAICSRVTHVIYAAACMVEAGMPSSALVCYSRMCVRHTSVFPWFAPHTYVA